MHEIALFGLLFLVCALALIALAESEALRDYAERRHVNYLADKSRRKKAQTMRPRSRYIRAGIQK